jgi:hypothetical protein
MIELAKTASSPKHQPPAAPPAEETRRTEEKKISSIQEVTVTWYPYHSPQVPMSPST